MENLTVEQRALVKLAIDRVIEQGCQSGDRDEDGDYQCLYRGPNGTKCAVGHLIADELYTPEIEQLSVRTDEIRELVQLSNPNVLLDHRLVCVLNTVQHCHDVAAPGNFVESFKGWLKENDINVS
jgi:hypothetical protein